MGDWLDCTKTVLKFLKTHLKPFCEKCFIFIKFVVVKAYRLIITLLKGDNNASNNKR